jgi:hypothetical protein
MLYQKWLSQHRWQLSLFNDFFPKWLEKLIEYCMKNMNSLNFKRYLIYCANTVFVATFLISKKECKWTWETIQHYTKLDNSAFIAVLHFTVTEGSSTMSITHIKQWMGHNHLHAIECYSLLSEVITISGHHCRLGSIWIWHFILQMDVLLSTRNHYGWSNRTNTDMRWDWYHNKKLPIRTKTNHSAPIRQILRKLVSLKLVHLLDGQY